MTNSNSLSSLSRNTALHHQSTSAAAASGQQLQVGQSTLLHKLSQSLKEKGSRLIDSSIVKEGHGKAESRDEILYEIAAVIAKDLNATGFHFYIVEDEQSIVRYEPGNSSRYEQVV